jgi:hypothetical protein
MEKRSQGREARHDHNRQLGSPPINDSKSVPSELRNGEEGIRIFE